MWEVLERDGPEQVGISIDDQLCLVVTSQNRRRTLFTITVVRANTDGIAMDDGRPLTPVLFDWIVEIGRTRHRYDRENAFAEVQDRHLRQLIERLEATFADRLASE